MSQARNEKTSVLPKEFRGVMYITGTRGVGKSFLAASADRPENILFLDFEEKGQGINAQLNFGKYVPLTSMAARQYGADYKPLQLYDLIRRTLNEVEQDAYTVAVIDNLEPFESSLLAEVKKFPIQYGINPRNAQTGAYGGAWPGVNNLISGYCNLLYSKGVRLIIATAHLKSVWGASGPVPNKWRPKGVERWHELSILSLVLLQGDTPPIPAALVQKEQLASAEWSEDVGELVIKRRLPLRLPKATFGEIRRYLREPADFARPLPGEVPTQEEALPFSDKFSKDQLQFMIASVEAMARGDKLEDDLSNEKEN